MRRLDRILVVGGSVAGLRAAESLRSHGFNGHLSVVGSEGWLPYNRPQLSKQLLLGARSPAQLALPIDDLDIDWWLGCTAKSLDRSSRELVLVSGQRLPYDGLVVATGLSARRLTVPGAQGASVRVLRTLDDAVALREDLSKSQRVTIVGAGFVGGEVASAARTLGCEVTLIDPQPHPLGRIVGPVVGGVLAGLHAKHGVRLRLGCAVVGLEAGRSGPVVRLGDGSSVEGDLVIAGLGAAPNVAWLAGTGLDLSDGLVCDERCRALGGGDRIVGAGDVAAWMHLGYGQRLRVEHWANATEQANAAAQSLLVGEAAEPFLPLPSVASHVHGHRVHIVGVPWLAERSVVCEGSTAQARLISTFWARGRMVGVVSVDMPARLGAYREALMAGMRGIATSGRSAAVGG